MKLNPRRNVILLSFVFLSFQLYAQNRAIQGVVTTFDSIPIHGATIKVQSTKQTVLTDTMGNYTVVCSKKDKLKILADGFYSENVKVEDPNRYVAVNLKLKAGTKNKEMALGFVHVNDHDKLNALASVNSKEIDFSQYRTMEDAVAGRIPGVQFSGGGIIIRGNSSINGPTYALIIIDGVSSDAAALNRLNPANVKSINVIKDGSSAIYGSQGANGVVVVETKTGRDN